MRTLLHTSYLPCGDFLFTPGYGDQSKNINIPCCGDLFYTRFFTLWGLRYGKLCKKNSHSLLWERFLHEDSRNSVNGDLCGIRFVLRCWWYYYIQHSLSSLLWFRMMPNNAHKLSFSKNSSTGGSRQISPVTSKMVKWKIGVICSFVGSNILEKMSL